MKLLVLVSLVLSANLASAFTVTAKEVRATTCAALQAELQKDGVLMIVDHSVTTVHALVPSCAINESPVASYIHASDKFCLAGYVCQFSGN